MTKIILHGGNTSLDSVDNKKFFLRMIEGLDLPKILLVYFSRPEKEWINLSEQDKEKFNDNCKFTLASKDNFPDEILENDVVYLRGGDTELLLNEIKKIDFKEFIKDKIVGGSSAGAYILSKYFYSNSRDDFFEGLGIINAKVFCHYTEDKKDRLEQLKNYKEDLPVYVLPDCKFVVLEA